jgi:hypothetical protein
MVILVSQQVRCLLVQKEQHLCIGWVVVPANLNRSAQFGPNATAIPNPVRIGHVQRPARKLPLELLLIQAVSNAPAVLTQG